jgi:hypothetical protein
MTEEEEAFRRLMIQKLDEFIQSLGEQKEYVPPRFPAYLELPMYSTNYEVLEVSSDVSSLFPPREDRR